MCDTVFFVVCSVSHWMVFLCGGFEGVFTSKVIWVTGPFQGLTWLGLAHPSLKVHWFGAVTHLQNLTSHITSSGTWCFIRFTGSSHSPQEGIKWGRGPWGDTLEFCPPQSALWLAVIQSVLQRKFTHPVPPSPKCQAIMASAQFQKLIKGASAHSPKSRHLNHLSAARARFLSVIHAMRLPADVSSPAGDQWH